MILLRGSGVEEFDESRWAIRQVLSYVTLRWLVVGTACSRLYNNQPLCDLKAGGKGGRELRCLCTKISDADDVCCLSAS